MPIIKVTDKLGLDTLDGVLDDLAKHIGTPTEGQLLAIGKMRETLVLKGKDYSGSMHTWANFEIAGAVVGLDSFSVFLALIGTKLARLVSLLASGAKPNYESEADTWLDLVNYIVLYIGYRRWLQDRPLPTIWSLPEPSTPAQFTLGLIVEALRAFPPIRSRQVRTPYYEQMWIRLAGRILKMME